MKSWFLIKSNKSLPGLKNNQKDSEWLEVLKNLCTDLAIPIIISSIPSLVSWDVPRSGACFSNVVMATTTRTFDSTLGSKILALKLVFFVQTFWAQTCVTKKASRLKMYLYESILSTIGPIMASYRRAEISDMLRIKKESNN